MMEIYIIYYNNSRKSVSSFNEIIHLDNYDLIESIYCYSCDLDKLPSLPKALVKLSCFGNNFKYLPELPGTLRFLWCENNFNLIDIPELPQAIDTFSYINTPIHGFIMEYFDCNISKYQDWKYKYQKKFANKIQSWYLDCKYNPNLKVGRDMVNKLYNQNYLE